MSTTAKKKRNTSWSHTFPSDRIETNEALKHVMLKMGFHSLSSGSITPYSESESEPDPFPISQIPSEPNYSSLLPDALMINVFGRVFDPKTRFSCSLVCKRWCLLFGRLIKCVKVLDWEFLESGRLTFRFPNLVDVDLSNASVRYERNSGVLLSSKMFGVYLRSNVLEHEGFFIRRRDVLHSEVIDTGVRILAEGCKDLRRVVLMNVGEKGLSWLAEECELLQEMELHYCGDLSLRAIRGFGNLQALKLVGMLSGVYNSVVSDIGMTMVAQGCRRLVKLELVGCEGSYLGIKAIGQCCHMLQELTLCDHRMEGGWLSALSSFGSLKSLSIESCKYVDENPGGDEELRECRMLEELSLRRCQVRDKNGIRALFLVCRSIRGLVIEDCWGLDSSTFSAAMIFRTMRSFSLEGCSLLTTEGLESVILSWKKLNRLKVVSCNNVKDCEITPELATLFSVLKELTWRPDTKSLLLASITGTGIGQSGGRSFKK